jgi:hypothetical protein
MRALILATLTVIAGVACGAFGEDGTPGAGPVPGSDAGLDGAPAETGVVPDDCTFCTSFDDDTFDGPWTGMSPSRGLVALEPTTDTPSSAPRALRVTVAASVDPKQGAYLYKRLQGVAGSGFRLAWRFRVVEANTLEGDLMVGGLVWRPDGDEAEQSTVHLELHRNQVQGVLYQTKSGLAKYNRKSLAVGTWHELAVDVTFTGAGTGATANAEFSVDGEVFDGASFVPDGLPQGRVELYAGGRYAAGGDFTRTVADWDDIVFHAR